MLKKTSNKIKRRCISMKNASSMEKCERLVSNKQEICGVHKRRKLLYLPDGSVWKNSNSSNRLSNCILHRPSIRFWEIVEKRVSLDRLNQKYIPEALSRLRVEKVSYLRKELTRLGVNTNEITEERYYWFLNILYYLGTFQSIVKKIQRFYRGPFQLKQEKRRKAVKVIWKYYLNYKFKKLLPVLIHHGSFLKLHGCINLQDPITQESFMEVNPERWVICQNDTDTCWWFDITSAIQLLGSPGSHAGENPFNRKEYPPAFLFDVEEKLNNLQDKYADIKNLTLSEEELTGVENKDDLPSECYSYKRFLLHIKSNVLFESFREVGYYFPRNIFLKYSLGELRVLSAKLYENWHICVEEERKRIFSPNGEVFPLEFTGRITTCSNSILMKNEILNTLLRSITFNNRYEDKIYSCLKTLMILGSINQNSHSIIRDNGLCDCDDDFYHFRNNQTALEILGNIMEDIV